MNVIRYKRRYARMVLALALLCFALVALVRLSSPPAAQASEKGAVVRKLYSDGVAAKYYAHFDDAAPFLPSNATTDTGEFIDPKSVPTAAYCGHCHQELHKEWRQSAHANSFRAPWYQKNVKLLIDTKGVEYSRHCEGCHNPIALTTGTITKGVEQKRASDEDGVTCMACHAMRQGDKRGTGSYVMSQPAVIVDEAGQPVYGKVSDLEILSHLDRHSKAVMQDFMKQPEFCGSCHKAALPKTLNDYKWQRALFVYDEWQMSSFAKQSPLPFYTKDAVSTCQTCHMGRESLTVKDPGAKNGSIASHRWIGANTLLPTYYKYDEQLARTKSFLSTNVFNVDLFSIEKQGSPALIAPLGSVPVATAPRDVLTVSVVIQNKGAAHSHVPEQRDMYESWVEFKVTDAAGTVVTH
ncbi:MAG: multiheme c-type cytochrome, partial [Janthinobacterium lividum]